MRIDVFLSADAEVNATLQSSWSLPWRQTPHIWQSCIWWANIGKTQESQCLHTIEWILILTMTTIIKRLQQLFMPQICIQGTACNPWIMRQQNRLLYISFSCPVYNWRVKFWLQMKFSSLAGLIPEDFMSAVFTVLYFSVTTDSAPETSWLLPPYFAKRLSRQKQTHRHKLLTCLTPHTSLLSMLHGSGNKSAFRAVFA